MSSLIRSYRFVVVNLVLEMDTWGYFKLYTLLFEKSR